MIKQKIYDIVEKGDGKSLSNVYDKVMMFALIISLVPLLTHQNYTVFRWIDVITSVLFLIDYILRWYTADISSTKRGRIAYLIYPFRISAIFDLLSILPVLSYVNSAFRIFRTWRLFKLLRIVRFFRYYEPLQIIITVLKKKAELFITIFGFALFYILVTALFMFNIEYDTSRQVGLHFFDTYLDAIYWATCTLTTVGYGDIYPVSVWGRIVSMISSLVGIAIIALPSGIITAGYMEEIQERRNKKTTEK